jgi:hypothetical protein
MAVKAVPAQPATESSKAGAALVQDTEHMILSDGVAK